MRILNVGIKLLGKVLSENAEISSELEKTFSQQEGLGFESQLWTFVGGYFILSKSLVGLLHWQASVPVPVPVPKPNFNWLAFSLLEKKWFRKVGSQWFPLSQVKNNTRTANNTLN